MINCSLLPLDDNMIVHYDNDDNDIIDNDKQDEAESSHDGVIMKVVKL